jgi:hypothetical protein
MNYRDDNQYEENKKRLRLLYVLFPLTRSIDDYEERKDLIYKLNWYEYHDADPETKMYNLGQYMWYDKVYRRLYVAVPNVLRFFYGYVGEYQSSSDNSTWD